MKSKCCGAELTDTIEWLGADYKRTKDGWILVKHICNQCHNPCDVEETASKEEDWDSGRDAYGGYREDK